MSLPLESQRALGLAALVLVIIGNAAGNVFLKLGAQANANRILFGLFGWQTAAGIACFAGGIVAYAWALKQIDLHVAQIIISVQYVTVIGLSVLLFGEQISQSQWCGIALIAAGLLLCAR